MLYVSWVCFMFSVVICTTVIYHSIYNFQVMYIYTTHVHLEHKTAFKTSELTKCVSGVQ